MYTKPRVLVVDDETSIRETFALFIEREGHVVGQAHDAASALALFQDDEWDVIIADIVMPGMNGRDLFSRLSRIRHDVRVIYMSGYTDDVIADHGVLDEGILFIQKPQIGTQPKQRGDKQ